ncbi:MAG: site-specific integrase [Trebonia sp.]
MQWTSPNTVKSYARSIALWWTYLHAFGLAWDKLSIADVGGFLAWLRTGDGPQVPSIEPRESRFTESTISTRLRAVTSCYRFHEMNGVSLGGDLVRVVHGGRSVYKPILEHVARKKGRQRAVLRVRTARAAPPVLTPGQIGAICPGGRRPRDPGSGAAGSGTASCGRCQIALSRPARADPGSLDQWSRPSRRPTGARPEAPIPMSSRSVQPAASTPLVAAVPAAPGMARQQTRPSSGGGGRVLSRETG